MHILRIFSISFSSIDWFNYRHSHERFSSNWFASYFWSFFTKHSHYTVWKGKSHVFVSFFMFLFLLFCCRLVTSRRTVAVTSNSNHIRSVNVHRVANVQLDTGIMGTDTDMVITKVRQQRQHPINHHSHRKVHRSRWMANYRQIRRWSQSQQQQQHRHQHDRGKSKRRRSKSTMSMWQSTWWVKRHFFALFFRRSNNRGKTNFLIHKSYRAPRYVGKKHNLMCTLLRLAWIYLSFEKHFPKLVIKFCDSEQKNSDRMTEEKINRNQHTWNHRIDSILAHLWHCSNPIYKENEKKTSNDKVVSLAKISFPSHNQYLPCWIDLADCTSLRCQTTKVAST